MAASYVKKYDFINHDARAYILVSIFSALLIKTVNRPTMMTFIILAAVSLSWSFFSHSNLDAGII